MLFDLCSNYLNFAVAVGSRLSSIRMISGVGFALLAYFAYSTTAHPICTKNL